LNILDSVWGVIERIFLGQVFAFVTLAACALMRSWERNPGRLSYYSPREAYAMILEPFSSSYPNRNFEHVLPEMLVIFVFLEQQTIFVSYIVIKLRTEKPINK
jgi:hypothetical protein